MDIIDNAVAFVERFRQGGNPLRRVAGHIDNYINTLTATAGLAMSDFAVNAAARMLWNSLTDYSISNNLQQNHTVEPLLPASTSEVLKVPVNSGWSGWIDSEEGDIRYFDALNTSNTITNVSLGGWNATYINPQLNNVSLFNPVGGTGYQQIKGNLAFIYSIDITVQWELEKMQISFPSDGIQNPALRFLLVYNRERNNSTFMPPGSMIVQSSPTYIPAPPSGTRFLDKQNPDYASRFIILSDTIVHCPAPQIWKDDANNMWRSQYCQSHQINIALKKPLPVKFADPSGSGSGLLENILQGAIYFLAGKNGDSINERITYNSRIGWSERDFTVPVNDWANYFII